MGIAFTKMDPLVCKNFFLSLVVPKLKDLGVESKGNLIVPMENGLSSTTKKTSSLLIIPLTKSWHNNTSCFMVPSNLLVTTMLMIMPLSSLVIKLVPQSWETLASLN